jgi:hypothetical protein
LASGNAAALSASDEANQVDQTEEPQSSSEAGRIERRELESKHIARINKGAL